MKRLKFYPTTTGFVFNLEFKTGCFHNVDEFTWRIISLYNLKFINIMCDKNN